jgi:hypothetical protein
MRIITICKIEHLFLVQPDLNMILLTAHFYIIPSVSFNLPLESRADTAPSSAFSAFFETVMIISPPAEVIPVKFFVADSA